RPQPASARGSRGDLTGVRRTARGAQAPPLRQNRRPKVYYATQVSSNPPTIVLFTNGPELFDHTYQRYLLKTFRDQLAFTDVPIKMYLRRRNREDREGAEELEAAAPAKKKRPAPRRKPAGKKAGRQESELWDDV